jgi:hypothetical protein
MIITPITKEYYENFDLTVLNEKLNFLVKKLSMLKSEKAKKINYTELYATYLQLVEIFCINTFAVSDNDLLTNIFLSNGEIREKIQARFNEESNDGKDFITYLLTNFVFANKDDKKDRTLQKSAYKHMIKESIDDYTKDKDFLNSYKHGFRVLSGEKNSLSIGMTGSSVMTKIQDYSASVLYYKKDRGSIWKCTVSFNWERVYVKALILINMLENMKKVYLNTGKKINFQYITFEDEEKISSKYGCFRICSPVGQ